VAGCCCEERGLGLDSGGEGVWVAVEAWERIVRWMLVDWELLGTYIWARGALWALIHSLWVDMALLDARDLRSAIQRWYGWRRSLRRWAGDAHRVRVDLHSHLEYACTSTHLRSVLGSCWKASASGVTCIVLATSTNSSQRASVVWLYVDVVSYIPGISEILIGFTVFYHQTPTL
jgi:hypothetical protein